MLVLVPVYEEVESVPLHPQAQGLVDMIAASGLPPLYEMSLEDARGVPGVISELIGPGPDVADVRDISVPAPDGDIGARVYVPADDPPGTIVYYHGGGWVIGSLDDWDAVCRVLAVESGCRVVSVDYRLAPEHPYPAAVDDSYAALTWVAANLADGRPIVVAGDSAGGNLATVAALRARDEQGPAIALQLLVYPVVDYDLTTSSQQEFSNTGLILNREEMAWFWDTYAPDEVDRANPNASPLRAPDLSGLPPAYVVIAGYDPLRDEGLAYAAKLEAAGVPVTVVRYDDQLHAFFTMVNLLESADRAVAAAAAAVRSAIGAAQPTGPSAARFQTREE